MNLLIFYNKVTVSPDGCMLWTGPVDKDGYGRRGAPVQLAHRFSYLINVGDLIKGMTIDHLCKNRRCVNPKHLEQVTHQENMYRAFGGTATHCPKGHERLEENTYRGKKGWAQCMLCINPVKKRNYM